MTGKLTWKNLATWTIEGQGWDNTAMRYSRLPNTCKGKIPENLYTLGMTSTGLHVCFESDSPAIHARWRLSKTADYGPGEHSCCGYSGLDLYAWDQGEWGWAGAGNMVNQPVMTQSLVEGLPRKNRRYLLFFPLRNTPTKVELGIETGSSLQQIRRAQKPVAYYGTSIVHGGFATRPGLAHPCLLSRWLDRPVINMGFSGAAQLEPEMAELLAELTPALYVIDPLANLSTEQVNERTEAFVKILRQARPAIPIILVENAPLTHAWLRPDLMKGHEEKWAAYHRIYRKLRRNGMKNLHYVRGRELFGTDSEASCDGIHPGDIGHLRMAKKLLPVVKKALVFHV